MIHQRLKVQLFIMMTRTPAQPALTAGKSVVKGTGLSAQIGPDPSQKSVTAGTMIVMAMLMRLNSSEISAG